MVNGWNESQGRDKAFMKWHQREEKGQFELLKKKVVYEDTMKGI